MTEQEARELIAKALDAEGWPNTAAALRNGDQEPLNLAIRVMLRTSDLERRALEACEQASSACSFREYELACEAAERIGSESIAAKKPKGPWRAIGPVSIQSGRTHYAVHNGITGGMQFFDTAEAADERVREQNEREAAR